MRLTFTKKEKKTPRERIHEKLCEYNAKRINIMHAACNNVRYLYHIHMCTAQ